MTSTNAGVLRSSTVLGYSGAEEWDDDFGGPSFIPRSLQSASVYLGDGRPWSWHGVLANGLTIHRSFLGDYMLDIIGSETEKPVYPERESLQF